MKILSVDLGTVRTGLAVCDPSETIASPLCVLTERSRESLFEKIKQEAVKIGAGQIVVGLPKNMDGSKGSKAQESEEAAQKLAEITGLPVELWDERCTTMSAISALNATNTRGNKRKAVVDAVAAVIILEDYLRFRKNTRGHE